MNRANNILLILAALASLCLQAVFLACYYRSSAFDEFAFIKSKIDRVASYSCAIEGSYNGLVSGAQAAILKLPSINTGSMVFPEKYDYLTMVLADRKLIFSLNPSDLSARKHKGFYIGNMGDFKFMAGGQMLYYECSIRGCYFSSVKCVDPRFVPVPVNGMEVF